MDNYFNEKEKYYINSQKYSECQLVAAINASIFLNELPVLQNSIEYERLVDLVCARIGAAISIRYAHEYLRIICYELGVITLNLTKKYLDDKKPIEVGVWHERVGFHSVLIIAYKKTENYSVQVLNFKQVTDSEGWIEWKIFKQYIRKVKPAGWAFAMDPWYIRRLQIDNNQRIIKEGDTKK